MSAPAQLRRLRSAGVRGFAFPVSERGWGNTVDSAARRWCLRRCFCIKVLPVTFCSCAAACSFQLWAGARQPYAFPGGSPPKRWRARHGGATAITLRSRVRHAAVARRQPRACLAQATTRCTFPPQRCCCMGGTPRRATRRATRLTYRDYGKLACCVLSRCFGDLPSVYDSEEPPKTRLKTTHACTCHVYPEAFD